MRRKITVLLAWAGLLAALTGCASLLERSYSVVEPYTDRYWDSGAEDTLKAENYQELVNSLLMLVEQRSEEGTVRFYYGDKTNAFVLANRARREVQLDTVTGAYLLEQISFTYKDMKDYRLLTYRMEYREDAEAIEGLMTISDDQSLTDLLRLAVREGHPRLTARFVYGIRREAVTSAVEAVWREQFMPKDVPGGDGELSEDGEASGEDVPPEEGSPEDGEAPEGEESPEDETSPEGEAAGGGDVTGEKSAGEPVPEPDYPPCPWEIRCYPDLDTLGIVEVLLEREEEAPPAENE